jgi:hypothetical protein
VYFANVAAPFLYAWLMILKIVLSLFAPPAFYFGYPASMFKEANLKMSKYFGLHE